MTDPCVGAAGIPLLQTAELRHSGRGPAAPFQLRCEDGAIVTVVRLLRVLPGKRIVGEASFPAKMRNSNFKSQEIEYKLRLTPGPEDDFPPPRAHERESRKPRKSISSQTSALILQPPQSPT